MTHAKTGKRDWSDVLFFYGLPSIITAIVGWYRWPVGGVQTVLTALALLVGLLFNLQVLLFDMVVRTREDDTQLGRHRLEVYRQIQVHVTYAIAVSLGAAIALGVVALAGSDRTPFPWSLIVVWLLAHFVLVLALILRRVRFAFIAESGIRGRRG